MPKNFGLVKKNQRRDDLSLVQEETPLTVVSSDPPPADLPESDLDDILSAVAETIPTPRARLNRNRRGTPAFGKPDTAGADGSAPSDFDGIFDDDPAPDFDDSLAEVLLSDDPADAETPDAAPALPATGAGADRDLLDQIFAITEPTVAPAAALDPAPPLASPPADVQNDRPPRSDRGPRVAPAPADLDEIFELDAPIPMPSRVDRPERPMAMNDLDRILHVGNARPTTTSVWRRRLIWAVILGGLVWVAFLPYAYEVGGDFIVQPIERAEARARTDGEIISLNVAKGDWVEADQILAVISNWDEKRDVILNEADDARLRAEFETMMAGARPEQIAVSQELLRTAEIQVEITARDLAKKESLFANGTIAEREMLDARDAHDLSISRRNEAKANLDLISSKALQTEIDAQLAAIARNDEETAFARLMLEYTNVRAPAEGQVVSDLTDVPIGTYLATGALFAEIEDNRTVIAEIDLPEVNVTEIAPGATAELRLWSAPNESIFGTVRAIAPRADPSDFGPVVRVQVEVPNVDGRIAANMTGYGKISVGELPVWDVFSRAILRFFTIELWSWIP